jgi:hypothetical protein
VCEDLIVIKSNHMKGMLPLCRREAAGTEKRRDLSDHVFMLHRLLKLAEIVYQE